MIPLSHRQLVNVSSLKNTNRYKVPPQTHTTFLLGPSRDKLLYIIHTNHKAEWRQTCYDSPRWLRPPSASARAVRWRRWLLLLDSPPSALHVNNSISPAARAPAKKNARVGREKKEAKATCVITKQGTRHANSLSEARRCAFCHERVLKESQWRERVHIA